MEWHSAVAQVQPRLRAREPVSVEHSPKQNLVAGCKLQAMALLAHRSRRWLHLRTSSARARTAGISPASSPITPTNSTTNNLKHICAHCRSTISRGPTTRNGVISDKRSLFLVYSPSGFAGCFYSAVKINERDPSTSCTLSEGEPGSSAASHRSESRQTAAAGRLWLVRCRW